MIRRSTTAIDCPTCERWGRVTVILPNGRLSTATCDICQGQGFIEPHWDADCAYCARATVGALAATPLF